MVYMYDVWWGFAVDRYTSSSPRAHRPRGTFLKQSYLQNQISKPNTRDGESHIRMLRVLERKNVCWRYRSLLAMSLAPHSNRSNRFVDTILVQQILNRFRLYSSWLTYRFHVPGISFCDIWWLTQDPVIRCRPCCRRCGPPLRSVSRP